MQRRETAGAQRIKGQAIMDKAILTDLYELTMVAAYVDSRKDDTATFELSIRTLPNRWGYYIANGIEDALDYLVGIRFDRQILLS